MDRSVSVESTDSSSSPDRRKSTSFLAVREAVYQLTCLNDFNCEKIGVGFFADVYKVAHRSTGEVMVLKMNKSRKNSKQMLAEIQLLNRLSHTNILGFKGSCVHEGQLHALTEYMNGGTLEDILHDTTITLPWPVRIKMASDIAKGMAYLHSRGVFHRDLTSKNCLLEKYPDGTIKTVVADFGLAAKIKHKRRSYTGAVGSAYWMAPECLHGKEYCEKADVFSYGIVLAEIISRLPADPDFLPRTNDFGIDFSCLRSLSDDGCPSLFWDLLLKCSQINPDDRPSFNEIVDLLDTISTETANQEERVVNKILVSSQSVPMLSLAREDTDGSYEFSDHSPVILSPSCDLEDTLSSLLGGSCSISHPHRNDFVLNNITSTPNSDHKMVGGDSGIDPGMWVRSVTQKKSLETNVGQKLGLKLEKKASPLIMPSSNAGCHYRESSDSSEISFHLPSPSYAWAPPSSPVIRHKTSHSFPSSPTSPKKPTTSSIDDSSLPIDFSDPRLETEPSPTDDVGVARHLSDSQTGMSRVFCYKDTPSLNCHPSISTPNLQTV